MAEPQTDYQISPDNFSHTASIDIINPDAVSVTTSVPQWAYLASKQGLQDIRVFNGENIAVAHQLSPALQEGSAPEYRVNAVAMPLYAEVGDTLRRSADVHVDSSGKVDIHLSELPQQMASSVAPKITQWVVDDQTVAATSINHFRFEITDANSTDFIADINIETSEDLRTWQPIVSNQKILNYGKQRLAQLGIPVTANKARYWRITANGEDLGRIARIYVSALPQSEAVYENLTVDCQLNPVRDALLCPLPGGGQLPLTSLKFDFGKQHVAFNAQINTYAKLPEIEKKNNNYPPTQTLYSLLTNANVDKIGVNGSPVAALVITARQGGKLGMKKPPQVTLHWPAQQLKFMVNGSAPFTLAVGADTLGTNAEQPIDSAVKASGGIIGKPTIKKPKAIVANKPDKQRPWLLWCLLAVAVLSLCWMAVSLLKKR